MATELGEVTAGYRIDAALQAVIAGGGAPLASLAATIAALAGIGGAAVDPATAADLWGNAAGFIVTTPQSLGEGETVVTLNPTAGNRPVDGAAFWNASTPALAAAMDFNTVTGLTNHVRRWYVTASGATRTVTAGGFDKKGNVSSSGVPIADGNTAVFFMWNDGTNNCIWFSGYVTDPWEPTASRLLGFDSNRIRALLLPYGKNSLWIPAGAWTPRTTNGCSALTTVELASNKTILSVLDFDTSADEHAQWGLWLPKSYNASTVTGVPLWTAASGSGTVCWSLRGRVFNDDDALDAAMGTQQDSTDTLITANDLHIGPAWPAITFAGTPAKERYVGLEIFRDVSADTLGVDARFIGAILNVTTDATTDD